MECRFVPEIDLFVCFYFSISSSSYDCHFRLSLLFYFIWFFICLFVCSFVFALYVCVCRSIRKSLTRAFVYLHFKISYLEC